jgi:hypothetical protein
VVISEEYKHQLLLTDRQALKRSGNSASMAKGSDGKSKKGNTSSQAEPKVMCFNCDRKGHYKTNCWHPGGGKEGQGPRQHGRRGGCSSKEGANAAISKSTQDNYAFAASNLATIAEQLKVPFERCGAIIDSGATSHFCLDWEKFTNYMAIKPQDMHTTDGSTLSTIRRGDVKLDLLNGMKHTMVMLRDTLFTLNMAFMLISTNQITAGGLAVHFEDQMCKILFPGPEWKVIATIPQLEVLYSIFQTSKHHANIIKHVLLMTFTRHWAMSHSLPCSTPSKGPSDWPSARHHINRRVL